MPVRRQCRSFGTRYLVRNTLVILGAGVLALILWFVLPTFHFAWAAATIFFGTILFIIAIEQHGFSSFHCPDCNEKLPKRDIWDGDEEITCFVCTACDIEWDTGLRIPHF